MTAKQCPALDAETASSHPWLEGSVRSDEEEVSMGTN
jgi:hypothetical protein